MRRNDLVFGGDVAGRLASACCAVALALTTLVACGPTRPAPKTQAPSPVADVPPPEPKRDLSEEGKSAFAEAAAALQQAETAGWTPDSCDSVADKFEDVYDSHPELVEAKFNEGAVHHACGQPAKAQEIYQDLLKKHPNYGPALNNLGQIALQRGERAVATGFFERAAAAKDSSGYANLALLQRDRALLSGDRTALKEAINNIHRALAVDSFNVGAYEAKATLVYDHAKTKSQLEIARLICVQAIKRFPRFAPVHNVLGLVLLRMDAVTRALKEFRQAVALDPDFVEAHMNIGAITLSFRDYRAADSSFSKVLSLSPGPKTKFEATVGLGVAYRGQKRFQQAMAKYKEAKALDSANAIVDYNMGILLQDYLFDASNPVQAIDTLQQARTLLQRFVSSSGGPRRKVEDARQRLKNIDEMVPLLREQQKMMQQSQQG